MTGFVAGFIGFLSPDSGLFGAANATDLHLSVPASQVAAATAEARERLSSAGILAGVDVRGDGRTRTLTASLQERDTETVDRARTALDGLVPGHAATSAADEERSNRLLGDIGTGTVTVLAVSFLVAIASAGITAASSILDRRQTYALLRLAGTPLEVLNRARRAETLIPLTVMGGGAIAIGVFCALPFAYSVMNLTGVITLLGCVVLGFAGVIGAGAASAPLLRSVTTDPAPRPD